MKPPAASDGPEAKALRKAAVTFAIGTPGDPTNDRANRTLLRAALAYARAAAEEKRAAREKKHEPSREGLTVSPYHECEVRENGLRCEYDEDEDPARDDCVHCHQPEERK